MTRTQKYEANEIVMWDNPHTKAQEEVRVVKCTPDDPIEPFYMIRTAKDRVFTHAFEHSLHAVEEEVEG